MKDTTTLSYQVIGYSSLIFLIPSRRKKRPIRTTPRPKTRYFISKPPSQSHSSSSSPSFDPLSWRERDCYLTSERASGTGVLCSLSDCRCGLRYTKKKKRYIHIIHAVKTSIHKKEEIPSCIPSTPTHPPLPLSLPPKSSRPSLQNAADSQKLAAPAPSNSSQYVPILPLFHPTIGKQAIYIPYIPSQNPLRHGHRHRHRLL